jgi:hypothetical protein
LVPIVQAWSCQRNQLKSRSAAIDVTGWQRLSYGLSVRNQQPGSLAEELRAWSRFVARGDLWIVGTNRLHEFDGGGHRKPDIQRSDLTRDRRLIEASWQRFGFTKAQLVNEGASIIASTDRLLGRSWDPERLRRWNALIANSMFGRPGRARALRHWRSAR